METQIYNSIKDISQENWDALHDGAFYFSHTFLNVVEQAQKDETELRYLVFAKDEKPVGAAVLSCFNLQLDLLAGEPKILKVIKKVFPKVFRLPIICCGLPVSFAQNHVSIINENLRENIVAEIHAEMQKFAKERKCKLLAWKEFHEDFSSKFQLKKTGYYCLPSLPDMQIHYNYKSAGELVDNLRSDYKRKFKTARNLFETGKYENLSLEISAFTKNDVSYFFKGYKAVLNRTPVKLEEYNEAFFDYLAYADIAEKLVIKNNKSESITALIIHDKKALNFILVSKEKDVYQDPLYPVLIKIIALLGAEKNVSQVKLGQTSTYAKFSAGAQAIPMEIYLRGENARVNFILDKAGKLLFPVTKTQQLNVWKVKPKHFSTT